VSMRRRLEFLEGRARQKVAGNSTEARERMSEQLGWVAALRRGELGSEEAAEVEAVSAAIEKRLASRLGNLGEGGS
jgi:hypothetical protein